MSLVLRELDEILPLAAAVAVAGAIPGSATIKWPNDIWIDGRKLAGILVEGRPQEGWAVLGIGLNVSTERFPDELAELATSLRLSGIEETTEAVLAGLLRSLDEWLAAPSARVLDGEAKEKDDAKPDTDERDAA